jgi:hypothetical protein
MIRALSGFLVNFVGSNVGFLDRPDMTCVFGISRLRAVCRVCQVSFGVDGWARARKRRKNLVFSCNDWACLMLMNNANLRSLTGGTRLKTRVQHPRVHERKDRGSHYWFFRYREDERLPDGAVKTTRRFHTIGPSRGEGALTLKQATLVRDQFLAERNTAATRAEAVVRLAAVANDPGQVIFGRLAEFWRANYVEKTAAGRPMVAEPTRRKYINHLEHHILPRWKDARLADLRAPVILSWLQEEATSWHMMSDLRGVMGGIISKAIEWELLPEAFANPIHLVRLPKKWEILTEEQTELVLALLDEPGNRLICETCLDTGTRISGSPAWVRTRSALRMPGCEPARFR